MPSLTGMGHSGVAPIGEALPLSSLGLRVTLETTSSRPSKQRPDRHGSLDLHLDGDDVLMRAPGTARIRCSAADLQTAIEFLRGEGL